MAEGDGSERGVVRGRNDGIDFFVNDLITIAIVAGVVIAAFFILLQKGYLRRLADYVRETKEELKKCSWPTWEELKGSTVVVMISILLLGLFTVGIDFVIAMLVNAMTRI